jgi:hypothetical protein
MAIIIAMAKLKNQNNRMAMHEEEEQWQKCSKNVVTLMNY